MKTDDVTLKLIGKGLIEIRRGEVVGRYQANFQSETINTIVPQIVEGIQMVLDKIGERIKNGE